MPYWVPELFFFASSSFPSYILCRVPPSHPFPLSTHLRIPLFAPPSPLLFFLFSQNHHIRGRWGGGENDAGVEPEIKAAAGQTGAPTDGVDAGGNTAGATATPGGIAGAGATAGGEDPAGTAEVDSVAETVAAGEGDLAAREVPRCLVGIEDQR